MMGGQDGLGQPPDLLLAQAGGRPLSLRAFRKQRWRACVWTVVNIIDREQCGTMQQPRWI